jgi:hypothetical protein
MTDETNDRLGALKRYVMEELSTLKDRVGQLELDAARKEETEAPPKPKPAPRPAEHTIRLLVVTTRDSYVGSVILEHEGEGAPARIEDYVRKGAFRPSKFFENVEDPTCAGRWLVEAPVYWRGGKWAIRAKQAVLTQLADDAKSLPSEEPPKKVVL